MSTMLMFDYVNLLVEFIIMSVSILSHKDNYYTFILSSYVFIGGGGGGQYICIYIYILVQFVRHTAMLLCTPVALS